MSSWGAILCLGLLCLCATMILSSATPPLPGNDTLTVDDSGDAEDADPNDGVCATDTGVCTLRAAIQQANARDNETDAVTLISFNISGDAPHRIQPRSSLPAITVPVLIDGTTQPASDGATTLSIELDGSRAGNRASGLTIIGGNSAIQGLVIHNFEDHGVLIDNAHNNTVGTADAGNSISGNQLNGIFISGMSTMNQVLKNALDANRNGVAIEGTGLANTIQDNQISNNLLNGILVSGTSTANKIQGNSIYSNAELGIDLGDDGVTPNDMTDADMGVNNLQNAPEISSAVKIALHTIIKGSLNSAPGKTYTLEFFANIECDDLDSGEGESFIGSITTTTDTLGDASFVFFRLIAQKPGGFITATATDPDGNTSEFSACVMIE